MTRLFGWTFSVLFTLVLLLAIASAWLLGTTDGARLAFDLLRERAPLEFAVREVHGRILGRLELRGVEVHTETADVALDRIELVWNPLTLIGAVFQVQKLDVQNLRVALRESPEPRDDAPFTMPQLPIGIVVERAQLDRVHLTQAGAEPQEVRDIALEALRWRNEELSVGRLAATHALTGPVQLSAQTRLARDRVHIQELELRGSGSAPPELRVQGTLAWAEKSASSLELLWQRLRWPLQDTAENTIPVSSPSGTLRVEGHPDAYRYALDAQLSAQQGGGRIEASGSGTRASIEAARLLLALDEARAIGRARLVWQPALSAEGDLRVRNLDPALIAPEWPGRLNGRLRAQSELSGETPSTQFELVLEDSRLRGYPLRADARGTLVAKQLKLERLLLISGGTRLQASGTLTPPFDATLKLESPDLAALLPELAGSAQLDARLRGSIQMPQVKASASLRDLRFQDWSLARADLQADLDPQGVSDLRLELRTLAGAANIAALDLKLRGRLEDHRLDLSASGEPGKLALGFQGALNRETLSWRGRLSSGVLTPPDFAAWTLQAPAALQVSRDAQALAPACWRAADSRVCAQASRAAEKLRAALRVEDFDFAYFESFVPASWRVRGRLDGTGMLALSEGRLTEAHADLTTTAVRVRHDGVLLLATEAGTLQIDDEAGVTRARLNLPLRAGHVRAEGSLAAHPDPAARPLRAVLDVRLEDLGALRALSREIVDPTGLVQGRLTWSGTVSQPIPQGAIRLQDGGMRLLEPGIVLREMSAELSSAGAGRIDVKAQATSGDGTLKLSGRIDAMGKERGAQFELRGKDFQAADIPDIRAWISPDLRIAWKDERIDVSGEVEVPRAEITPKARNAGIAPSEDQVIVKPDDKVTEAVTTQLAADVRIVLGENVRFEGFGLTTRLGGSVRAIDEPARRQIGRGEVRLVDGRYEAYGQDLEIETGRLLWNGGPLTEPAVEIRALREPREGIEVGVQVRGTLDRPEFTLYSTPTMTREQQLSWLVLGRPLEQASGADERAAIANAALALGLAGTDSLAGRFSKRLRLDEISVGSAPGDEAEQARVTLGKYLSPRIFVSYGISLFEPGQVFKLLYDLGRGFKLQTESGVNTGGDLLYSIERP